MDLIFRTLSVGLLFGFSSVAGRGMTAEERAGERLFQEIRFGQFFAARSGGEVNGPFFQSDGSLTTLVVTGHAPAISCQICHLGHALDSAHAAGLAPLARGPIPARDGDHDHFTTPRNSPALASAIESGGPMLLHYDGEFASARDLVVGTFLGRNFGWLPDEAAQARRHFARVIREDDGKGELARVYGGLSYAVLLRGEDKAIPENLRLPVSARFDPLTASDEKILERCADMVVAFLRTLQFSRDESGQHNGSAYDSFLIANRLPRAPVAGQSPAEYTRRLREASAALRAPRLIEPPTGADTSVQAPRFGEMELKGMRIFFRDAIGESQKSGAGNCAECHAPPHFSDFAFHNTGVAQEEYDAAHGAGAFVRLLVPDLESRTAEHNRWLPRTSQHPRARGQFIAPTVAAQLEFADLGLWNVWANPDFPAPQTQLARLLDPSGKLSANEVLSKTLARFKTPTVRGLGASAPYLHNGSARTLEDSVRFYVRASALARGGKLRNAPNEFFGMRLAEEDVEPLVAFLRSLNETPR